MSKLDIDRILGDLQRMKADIETDMSDTDRQHKKTKELAERIEAIRKRREEYDPAAAPDPESKP